jgi:hypothetical protein
MGKLNTLTSFREGSVTYSRSFEAARARTTAWVTFGTAARVGAAFCVLQPASMVPTASAAMIERSLFRRKGVDIVVLTVVRCAVQFEHLVST